MPVIKDMEGKGEKGPELLKKKFNMRFFKRNKKLVIPKLVET